MINATGEGGYKIACAPGLRRWLWCMIIWICPLSRPALIDVWYPPVWSPASRRSRWCRPAIILRGGVPILRGRIYTDAEASDAGRHQAVGGARICSPMAISARSSCSARSSAWAVFDRISLKHRADAGAPADPESAVCAMTCIAVVVGAGRLCRARPLRFIRP